MCALLVDELVELKALVAECWEGVSVVAHPVEDFAFESCEGDFAGLAGRVGAGVSDEWHWFTSRLGGC